MSRETETSEFPAMIARLNRAWAARVAQGDTYDLREMVDVVGIGADVVTAAIRTNRAGEGVAWSWAEIGDALGITRQAAQQRWAKLAPRPA